MARGFNPTALLNNLAYIKDLVRRIRYKEGGIGSDADELVLSRLVFDVDMLLELVEALGVNNKKLLQMVQDGAKNEPGPSGEAGQERGRDENIQLDQTPP